MSLGITLAAFDPAVLIEEIMLVTRPRVLVVDDNATWRETITRILEADHELVGTVVRGDEIMESAERLCPDVITLPVVTGNERTQCTAPAAEGLPPSNHRDRQRDCYPHL